MTVAVDASEKRLNDFDPEVRRDALRGLVDQVSRGEIELAPTGPYVNLHCHTFYSYNGYGYSPSRFAWRARKEGLYVAGIVDFDVLDAVPEFLDASRMLGLRGCAGMETRVYVEEFATREINSPGEPGIAYVVGVGFVPGAGVDAPLSEELRRIAGERTRAIAERVNPYLYPAAVDYDIDVVGLTPNGNATERHLCIAYDKKVRELFPDAETRASFWEEKLGQPMGKIKAMLDDGPALQALIRAKTMKAGGVGYTQPAGPEFPALARFNDFVKQAGAIPTYAFLDGTTSGEKDIEELLDVMVASGVAGITLIPERNWNLKDPAVKQVKLDKLYAFVELAKARDLPLFAGTEMNAHGQRFVDEFDTPELKPLLSLFQEGALIQYAHTVLQEKAGMGYLSDWAQCHFKSAKEKNAFFSKLGEKLDPATAASFTCTRDMEPEDLL